MRSRCHGLVLWTDAIPSNAKYGEVDVLGSTVAELLFACRLVMTTAYAR
jgi:hypothetical protein